MTSHQLGALIEPVPSLKLPARVAISSSSRSGEIRDAEIPLTVFKGRDETRPPSPSRLEDNNATHGDASAGTEVMQSFWQPYMNRYRVVAACIIAFALGLNDAAPGALLLYIESHYTIGYAVASIIFVANAFGFISAAFLANTLTVRIGRAKTLIVADVFKITGYVLIASTPPFPVVVLGFFLTGTGMAISQASMFCSVLSVFSFDGSLHQWLQTDSAVLPRVVMCFMTDKRRRQTFANGCVNGTNLMFSLAVTQVFTATLAYGTLITGVFQGFYGIGGTIGPLIASSLVTKDVIWSRFYLIPMSLAAADIFFSGWSFWNFEDDYAVFHQEPMLAETTRTQGRWSYFKKVVATKTIMFGSAFIFSYQGTEVAISGWVITFLVNYRGGDPSKVGYVTSGFWAGVTIGRFVLSHIGSAYMGERNFVFALTAGALVLQLLVWFVPSIIGDSIGIALAGVLLGPIYPAATQVFVRLIPRQDQVAAFSFIGSVGSSGGAFTPFLTGLVAQLVGTWVLHPICITFFVIMLGLWYTLPKISKRSE